MSVYHMFTYKNNKKELDTRPDLEMFTFDTSFLKSGAHALEAEILRGCCAHHVYMIKWKTD